jgi:hypothetical protein
MLPCSAANLIVEWQRWVKSGALRPTGIPFNFRFALKADITGKLWKGKSVTRLTHREREIVNIEMVPACPPPLSSRGPGRF